MSWTNKLSAEAGWYHLWHSTKGQELCWVSPLRGKASGRYADVFTTQRDHTGCTAWMVDKLIAEGCLFHPVAIPEVPAKGKRS